LAFSGISTPPAGGQIMDKIIKFTQPRQPISGSIFIEKTTQNRATLHFNAAERDFITVQAPDPDTAIKIYKESERLLIKDREKYIKATGKEGFISVL